MNQSGFGKVSEAASNTAEKGLALDELIKQSKEKVDGELSVLSKIEAKNVVKEKLSGIVDTFKRLGKNIIGLLKIIQTFLF